MLIRMFSIGKYTIVGVFSWLVPSFAGTPWNLLVKIRGTGLVTMKLQIFKKGWILMFDILFFFSLENYAIGFQLGHNGSKYFVASQVIQTV